MTTQRRSELIRYTFFGAGLIPATGSANASPFVKKITGAGPPTVAATAGEAVLALEATSEVQNACLYQDDDLGFDIDLIKSVAFYAKASVAFGAAAKWRFGLAVARNDDPDAIVTSILFGADGAGGITAESDDGVNEVAAVATGLTLATTLKRFVIDFTEGITSVSPPSLSTGGKARVGLSIANDNGFMRPVAKNSVFNLSNFSDKLQIFAQVQKTSSTDVGTLAIQCIEIDKYVA